MPHDRRPVDLADPDGAACGDRRSPTAARRLGIASWIVVPLGLAAWVYATHGRFYFVFDEWVMIDRATRDSPLREMLIGFNGHLWIVGFWVAKLHVDVFGTGSSTFSYAVLALSLLLLQILAAFVLLRLGVNAFVALLAAGLVTYFGRGSETMVYELEYSANLALAASCAAAVFVLGRRVDRRTGAVVAALLVLATLIDSGLALVSLFFVATLLLALWPRRLAIGVLTVALGVHAAWFVVDHTQILVPDGPCQNCSPVTFNAPLGDSLEFGGNLALRAAGGLVGGTEAAGVFVLVALIAVVAFALMRLSPSRVVVAGLIGGSLAALVAVGSITYSRAGFWKTIDEAIALLDISNRYVQPVAFFLLLGVAPVLAVAVRSFNSSGRLVLGAIASVVIVGAFALNLGSVDDTRGFYESWSTQVRNDVSETIGALDRGCPDGKTVDHTARPVDASFQIDVQLIEDLLERGALTPDDGSRPSKAVLDRMCRMP